MIGRGVFPFKTLGFQCCPPEDPQRFSFNFLIFVGDSAASADLRNGLRAPWDSPWDSPHPGFQLAPPPEKVHPEFS